MYGTNIGLSNMPSPKNLSERKEIKEKFIKLEKKQLLSCINDLEQSLSIYKQISLEILAAKFRGESINSGNDTFSFASSKIFENLIVEKNTLEERLHRSTVETEKAMEKNYKLEYLTEEIQKKEQKMIQDCNKKIYEFLQDSECKEKAIKDLQLKNSMMKKDIEIYNKSREGPLTISEQKDLIKKKGKIMLEMLQNFEKKHQRVYQNIENLSNQCSKLVMKYRWGNSMLRDPLPDFNLEEIFSNSSENSAGNNSWKNNEKLRRTIAELGIDKKNQNFCVGKNINNDKGKLKICENKKLEKKCNKHQIKLQIILQEIENAKNINLMLKQDQCNLKKDFGINIDIQKKLEKEKKNMTENAVNNENTIKKAFRSNSNPLDYAQFKFNQKKKKVKKIESRPQGFKKAQDKDSSIRNEIYIEDNLDDSLINVFENEQGN